mgnify:FL=1
MATERTPRERVMEAVTRGLEIVATLNEARASLGLAKRDEDAVRAADRTKEIGAAATARQLSLQQAAQAECQEQVAEARKPLDEAQAVFDRMTQMFTANRDRLQQEAKAEAEAAILDAKREQETKAAIARAGVHTAQQVVNNLEADIDKYARQVHERLGIDLKQLLAIARE